MTGEPLQITPRFTGDHLRIVQYANPKESERFVLDTFGSQHFLWDFPDVFRFDMDSRRLVGAEFQMPCTSPNCESTDRVPVLPALRPGGLRADEVQDFRHEMCPVLCRVPGDTVLACLHGLDVLDEPVEARIGIAPDVALLVQHGVVVGWSLTNPAQYLTTAYADPDPAPPSPATRRLLTECLDLVTDPLIYDVEDREPVALARLRAADEALRDQCEDRHRADALRELIANIANIYGNW
ncbi:hypothetical protein [Streptomyces sp. WM6372]|uniref:hypothetical protein n=1 Tax=Streptomyces sp. WM6372 TaxID=1415555 RepID=UPI001F287825|nr:hypothetical protein [Streptomyces sp. WM6372]